MLWADHIIMIRVRQSWICSLLPYAVVVPLFIQPPRKKNSMEEAMTEKLLLLCQCLCVFSTRRLLGKFVGKFPPDVWHRSLPTSLFRLGRLKQEKKMRELELQLSDGEHATNRKRTTGGLGVDIRWKVRQEKFRDSVRCPANPWTGVDEMSLRAS